MHSVLIVYGLIGLCLCLASYVLQAIFRALPFALVGFAAVGAIILGLLSLVIVPIWCLLDPRFRARLRAYEQQAKSD